MWWGRVRVGRPASELGAEMGMSEEDICAVTGYCYGGGTLTEVTTYGKRPGSPAWSVLRTGKGDLALLAAQDVRMKSGFGVYTAGTPTHLGDGSDPRFNAARAPKPENTLLLGSTQASGAYDAALASYEAWYPDQGGNLRIEAGRDIIGDTWSFRAESGTVQRDRLATQAQRWATGCGGRERHHRRCRADADQLVDQFRNLQHGEARTGCNPAWWALPGSGRWGRQSEPGRRPPYGHAGQHGQRAGIRDLAAFECAFGRGRINRARGRWPVACHRRW